MAEHKFSAVVTIEVGEVWQREFGGEPPASNELKITQGVINITAPTSDDAARQAADTIAARLAQR